MRLLKRYDIIRLNRVILGHPTVWAVAVDDITLPVVIVKWFLWMFVDRVLLPPFYGQTSSMPYMRFCEPSLNRVIKE